MRKLANVAIFDVHKSLNELPGSVRIRNDLVKAAVDYLDGLAIDAGSDPTLLGELGAGYVTLGGIQGASIADGHLGEQAAGRTSVVRGLTLLKDAHNKLPGDQEIGYQYALALRKMAELEWSSLNFAATSNFLQTAIEVSQFFVLKNRANFEIRLELTGALISKARMSPAKLVMSEVRADSVLQGLSQLEKMLKETLSSTQKDKVQQNISIGYNTLAEIVMHEGKPDSSLRSYELGLKSLAISEERLKANPNSKERQFNIAVNYQRLATNAMELKRNSEAVGLYNKAVLIFERISQADPEDQNAKMYFIYALANLAEAQSNAHDTKTSVQTLERAVALRKSVPANNLDHINHRYSAFLISAIYSRIESYEAMQPGLTRRQRISFCARAVDRFQEMRKMQVSLKDVFLNPEEDPALEIKRHLQICAPFVTLPN